MFKEFKKFILRGNVVDLAVAVVVGAAFGEVVTSLVKNFVTPLISAFGGLPNFEKLSFTLNGSTFKYGLILNSLIAFISVAAVVFFFIIHPLNKLMAHAKPSDDVDKPAERECPECLSAIPSGASRCKFCGATSKPTSKTK